MGKFLHPTPQFSYLYKGRVLGPTSLTGTLWGLNEVTHGRCLVLCRHMAGPQKRVTMTFIHCWSLAPQQAFQHMTGSRLDLDGTTLTLVSCPASNCVSAQEHLRTAFSQSPAGRAQFPPERHSGEGKCLISSEGRWWQAGYLWKAVECLEQLDRELFPIGDKHVLFSAWHCPAWSVNSKTNFNQAIDFWPVIFKRTTQDTSLSSTWFPLQG